MSWTFYLGSIAFFWVVFAVFYALASSLLLGVRDNYLRYYQKADLQWTAPTGSRSRRRPSLWMLLAASLMTAWIVVHFVIQPRPL